MTDIKKIGLICSSGGHLFQLYSLEEFWKEFKRFWVTFEKEDTNYLLKMRRSIWHILLQIEISRIFLKI